ncbi:MAG: tRNA (adenosine(37)-N6)-dimethylallyltransferase MiaA [Pseudomonadota bacterium]
MAEPASRQAVLIAGPTASGKSACALAVAAQIGGTIINCDSMQVYADLAVLTARPDPAVMAAVPHRLYGHIDAARAYSVGAYARDVAALLAAPDLNAPLIFVGGTGLYFAALTDGLSPIPDIPSAVRDAWRARMDQRGPGALHAELMRVDPVTAAQIRTQDRQRIVRALEVFEATGRPLSAWQDEPARPLLDGWHIHRFVLTGPRDTHYARADARVPDMIARGALAEVAALRDRHLAPDLPCMRAIGVRPLMAHMAGALTLEAATDQMQQDTRRYIKRQTTWSRARMQSWKPIEISDSCANAIVNDLLQKK